MTTGADPAFLDTNVLLAASDPARATHADATAVLEDWYRDGVALTVSAQVLREYLVVATRPRSDNGLGLSRSQALDNVAELSGRLTLLAVDRRVHAHLLDLLATTKTSGKRIHDANVVATMLAHGVDRLVTDNVRDFARFRELVRVEPLRGAAG